MKQLCFPIFCALLGSIVPGAAVTLAIANPGFEQDGTLIPGGQNPSIPIASDPGDYTFGPNSGAAAGGSAIPGWDAPFAPGSGAGIFNPVGSPSGSAHSGSLVAYANVNNGFISQPLSLSGGDLAIASPGASITLSGWFSNRNSNTAINLRVSLRVAPNVNVVAPLLLDLPDTPDWTAWTASFTLPDAATLGASANQPLFTVLEPTASQILLDDISGTYSAVPEPAAAGLMTIAGFLGLRRRRSAAL
ncbi:MAG: PEP-CTERM sorting domain-containing protein [Verrucomicrobiota bacterium]